MTLLDEIHINRDIILQQAAICGLTNIRVFGSVARREETATSDIDILASRIPNVHKGLHTYIFPAVIEKMFKRKVDFVVDTTLHWAIKDQILREATPV